jgi:hypothetical protein
MAKIIKKISKQDFVDLLKNTKGCKFINIVAETSPAMNKKGNPYFDRVTKRTIAVMQFGYSYENAVNNRATSDEHFVADAPKGREWLVPNKVLKGTNNDTIYIRTYIVKNSTPKVCYLIDDKQASKDEIEELKTYLRASSKSTKQESFGLVENQVQPRDYKIESIKCITIDKVRYEITD